MSYIEDDISVVDKFDVKISFIKSSRNKTGHYSGVKGDIEELDRICVFKDSKCRGLKFDFNFENMLYLLQGEVSNDLIKIVTDEVMSYSYDLSTILFDTIEGQEFLELVLSRYTEWHEDYLDLKTPVNRNNDNILYINDLITEYKFENERGDKWESEEDELDRYINNLEPVGSDIFEFPIHANVTYVLRLLDENWNHWLYVGESNCIYSRLSKHIKNGGDFAAAKRNRMEVIKIEELRTDISEKELYKEVSKSYDVSSKRICGGR